MKRSLDQFIEFTGMDTRTQTAFGDRCRQLEWVPFIPDENADVDSADVWGFNPEIVKANGPNIPLLTGSIEYKALDAAQSAGLSSGSSLHSIHLGKYLSPRFRFSLSYFLLSIFPPVQMEP